MVTAIVMITLFKKSQKIVFNIQSQLYNTILTTTVPGYNMALLEWVMPLQFAHIKKNKKTIIINHFLVNRLIIIGFYF